jgi:hypothetical protein
MLNLATKMFDEKKPMGKATRIPIFSAGGISLVFTVFHTPFFYLFKWKESLAAID